MLDHPNIKLALDDPRDRPIGNPIDENNLPAEQCEIVCQPLPSDDPRRDADNALLVFIAAMLVGIIPVIPVIGPLLLVLVAVIYLFDALFTAFARRRMPDIGSIMIMLLMVPLAFTGLFVVINPVIAYVMLRRFTMQFARHNIGLQLATPVKRSDAAEHQAKLIAEVQGRLFPLALLYFFVFFLAASVILPRELRYQLPDFISSNNIIASLLLTGFVLGVVAAIFGGSGAYCRGFLSWASYNLTERIRPGTYRSPSGDANSRMQFTLCTALVLGTTMLVPANVWIQYLGLFGPTTQSLTPSYLGYWDFVFFLLFPGYCLCFVSCVATGTVLAKAESIRRRALMNKEHSVPGSINRDLAEARRPYEQQEAQIIKDNPGMDPLELRFKIEDEVRDPMPVELKSFVPAINAEDDSPVLLPFEAALGHGAIFGDSGLGKTSRAFLPLIHNLASFARSSFVILDLKGDSNELLTALFEVQHDLQDRGIEFPVRFFSAAHDEDSHAFNPLDQPYLADMPPEQLAGLQLKGLGIAFSQVYGESWFGSASEELITTAFQLAVQRGVRIVSPRQLHPLLEEVAERKNKLVHESVQKAGIHPVLEIKRLTGMPELNYVAQPGDDPLIAQHRITFADAWKKPRAYYFKLPINNPRMGAKIARYVFHTLLATANSIDKSERTHNVFLFIDEWQNMISSGLEALLLDARSMDVSCFLACQSPELLRSSKLDLLTACETSCRLRWYFGQSVEEDAMRLQSFSGTTNIPSITENYQIDSLSGQISMRGFSLRKEITSRFSRNSIAALANDEELCAFWVRNKAGYSNYRGLPFLARVPHHQSKKQFRKAEAFRWPNGAAGTISSRTDPTSTTPAPSPKAPTQAPTVKVKKTKQKRRRNNGQS